MPGWLALQSSAYRHSLGDASSSAASAEAPSAAPSLGGPVSGAASIEAPVSFSMLASAGEPELAPPELPLELPDPPPELSVPLELPDPASKLADPASTLADPPELDDPLKPDDPLELDAPPELGARPPDPELPEDDPKLPPAPGASDPGGSGCGLRGLTAQAPTSVSPRIAAIHGRRRIGVPLIDPRRAYRFWGRKHASRLAAGGPSFLASAR